MLVPTLLPGAIMSDNLQKAGPQDRSRINLHEEWEVRHWTEALGVSRAQLEQAVAKVGVSAEAVRAHLLERA
jgi:hypothetical protein